MKKIFKYWNTCKKLKIIQILYGFKNYIFKSKRKDLLFDKQVNKHNLCYEEIYHDDVFLKKFDYKLLAENKVNILNNIVDINFADEYIKNLKPLISFNLQYFEYAVYLGCLYKKTKNKDLYYNFKKIYSNYLKSKSKSHPYIYSLQIPNILIAIELFEDVIEDDFKKVIYNELYSQYKYVLKNQEKHLLANHYYENLKAIVIGAYVFGDKSRFKQYFKKLRKELSKQILADGFHFELSGMYHKLVLEGLLYIYNLTKNCEYINIDWLRKYIVIMCNAMLSFEKGFNRIPLFNDAGDNVAKSSVVLKEIIINNISSIVDDNIMLDASGYYKMYNKDLALIVDVGICGPNYNLGHAHCDCLSFELSHKGDPVFVNSGTYHYQDKLRSYFRSTIAHNTFHIENDEQSECWGEHRVARTMSKKQVKIEKNFLVGGYNSYLHNEYYRTIELKDYDITVLDKVLNLKESAVNSYLRVAPNYQVKKLNNRIEICKRKNKRLCVIEPVNCEFRIYHDDEICVYAENFGTIKNSTCIVFDWKNDKMEHGYKIKFAKEGNKND